jgi:hypothetical protein
VGAQHLSEDPLDLGHGHDDRRAGPPFGPDRFKLPLDRLVKHPAVKETNRVQRLSLRCRGNMKMSRQMA